MSKIITIMIRKGGSGKTSTAVNLASGLAKQGKRVLLLDLDSQANAGLGLGVVDEFNNIASVLGGKININDAIHKVGDVDLIPSSGELAGYENALTAQAEVFAIKSLLEPIRSSYDYIIIDTPPSDGVVTRNALVASDYALIPAQAQTFAIKGLQQALELLQKIKDRYNPSLKLAGIVPTMLQANTNVGNLFMSQLKGDYTNKVLPYAIPLTIKITESQLVGQPILNYDPNHPTSKVYLDLAKYIINLNEGNQNG